MEFFGTHIAPEPVTRTVCMATGSVLQGNGIPSWESMWPKSTLDPVRISNDSSAAIVVTNGVLNDKVQAKKMALYVKDNFPNCNLYCFHVASWGLCFDLMRCGLEYVGISTVDLSHKARCMHQLLADLGPDGRVVEIAHSRGGMILSRALDRLPTEDQQRIVAYTVGSPRPVRNTSAQWSQNDVIKRDMVAWLSFGCAGWRWQAGRYNVHYVHDSRTELVPHVFCGGDYEQEWGPWLERAAHWANERAGHCEQTGDHND